MKNSRATQSVNASSIPNKVMLVCDHSEIGYIWIRILRDKGFQTVFVESSAEVLKQWNEELPDLIIIDENSSKLDGIQLVTDLRSQVQNPIILITPNNNENYILSAYKAGVDECIPKPLSPALFLAIVRASLRRARTVPIELLENLEVAGLRLDPVNRAVISSSGRVVRLSQLEYRLLHLLITSSGRVLSPEEIINHVWGYSSYGDSKLLKHLIFRLRKKIEANPRTPKLIKTEQGVGYKFVAE